MLSVLVARLRLSFLLLLVPLVAAEDTLFTSSVTYCQPPETLLIQQFDLAYYASNQSVSFNISASSVSADVNVTANILLNVYGMKPLNVSIDLCSILNGALCPLPVYNFKGSASITLPASLGISQRIPDIAFRIPDLEAVAQLTLAEVGTNQVKACVQATLSNHWSARQPAVEWTTRGLAIAVFVVALPISMNSRALIPFRFLDLIYLFQSIAFSGLLALNFPSVYRSFSLNFSWALGLFPPSPKSGIQKSIDNMRALTGGDMPNSTADSAVGLVNRKLSPYNYLAPASSSLQTQSLFLFDHDSTRLISSYISTAPMTAADLPAAGNVQTITSTNTLQAGLPIYANSLHIATANAFMTVFFFALILLVVVAGVLILGYVGLRLAVKYHVGDRQRLQELVCHYPAFARSWALRLCLIFLLPVALFAFYQWTLHDSWLSLLLSVILLLSVTLYTGHSIMHISRFARHSAPRDLYKDSAMITAHGALYSQYRDSRFYFFAIIIAASISKSIVAAFIKDHGKTQVILLIIVDASVFLANVVLKPHHSRGSDVVSIYLSFTRLLSSGLMIAFVESLAVAAIPRVVIGIVIAIAYSIAVIVLFLNILVHLGGHIMRRHVCTKSKLSNSTPHSDGSLLEKGSSEEESPTSSSLRSSLGAIGSVCTNEGRLIPARHHEIL